MDIDAVSKYSAHVGSKTVEKVGLPPSNYPFEATLYPGQEITLHGGNRFINDTNEVLKLRIQFDLKNGYHVFIESETTSAHQYITMGSTHRITKKDGQLQLNAVEKQPSMRTFKMKAQKV